MQVIDRDAMLEGLGKLWQMSGGKIAIPLAQSAVALTCPIDTTEDILVSVSIPPNALGINGALRVTQFWSCTNNANAKQVRTRFGGIGGTVYGNANIANNASFRVQCQIHNRGAANSQHGNDGTAGGWSTQTLGITGAIDTSAVQTLIITAQKGTGADALVLESYLIELLTGLS